MPGEDAAAGRGEAAEFIVFHRSTARREIGAVLWFVVAALLLRWKGIGEFSTAILGGTRGDGGLYLWLTQSNVRDLFDLAWFNTRAFYPYGESLAWSDNYILPSLLSKMLLEVGMPLAAAYNSVLVLAVFLNGYLMFRLVFRVAGNTAGALAAGTAFVCFPYFTHMLGHPQLQFAFWFPLLLSALLAYLARPALARGALIGILLVLTFATTTYYAVFGAALLAATYASLIALRPRFATIREHAALLVSVALGAVPGLPFVLPYFDALAVFGERELYEPFYFAASSLSYLSAPPLSAAYGATSTLSHEEGHLFPGLVPLAALVPAFLRISNAAPLRRVGGVVLISVFSAFVLSAAATGVLGGSPELAVWCRYAAAAATWAALLAFFVFMYRLGIIEHRLGFTIVTNRALLAIALFLTLVFFALSLGPLGNVSKGQVALGVHRVFYELFPGFDSLRAIGRAGVVTDFALALNLGLVISFLVTRIPAAAKLAYFVPLLVLAETYVRDYPVEGQVRPSTVVDALERLPRSDDAVIALPFAGKLGAHGRPESWGEFARLQVDAMNLVQPTRWRTVNGYSGQRTKLMYDLPRALARFPDERSIGHLSRIFGLRYVIFRSAEVPGFDRDDFMRQASLHASSIRYIDSDGEGNFLFEFLPLVRLEPDTELLVPAYPRGVMHFELMTAGPARADRAVDVTARLLDDSDTPVSRLVLTEPGSWQQYSITIPPTPFWVTPLKVRFTSSDDGPLYIREMRYQVLDDGTWLTRLMQRYGLLPR